MTAKAPANKAPESKPAETPALSFEDVDVPDLPGNRSAEANPFADVFPLRMRGESGPDDKGQAKSFTVPYRSEDEHKAYDKLARQIRSAANAKGVTARIKYVDKDGKRTVTFWNIPLVTRPRKAAEGEQAPGDVRTGTEAAAEAAAQEGDAAE